MGQLGQASLHLYTIVVDDYESHLERTQRLGVSTVRTQVSRISATGLRFYANIPFYINLYIRFDALRSPIYRSFCIYLIFNVRVCLYYCITLLA